MIGSDIIPTLDVPIYDGPSGPTVNLPHGTKELDYLYSEIGDDFFNNLADNTNEYTVFKCPVAHPNAADRLDTLDKHWYSTTADEIKAYIGINILMGIAQLPEGRDYWSSDQLLHNDYVAKRFSRNRFEKLSRYLHISDPTTPDATDKLYKVRTFLNKLEDKFHTSYTPGPNVSVDEAMIQFDGRLGWKHKTLVSV